MMCISMIRGIIISRRGLGVGGLHDIYVSWGDYRVSLGSSQKEYFEQPTIWRCFYSDVWRLWDRRLRAGFGI